MNGELEELLDELARALARQLPRRVVYWVGLRILAAATLGDRGPGAPAHDQVRLWDELDRWRR